MASKTMDVLTGFRRRLIVRLVAVGLLASILAGIAAYFIETERLDENLVDQASLEARTLSASLSLGDINNDERLKSFLQEHSATSRDFFVLAEAYDSEHRSIGEAELPNFDEVDPYFNRKRHPFPELGDPWYTKEVINGTPYL